jgi:hypothetical protein
MKLVALKRISDRLPKGQVFDEPNPRAKMLVAIGLAKPYVEPVAAPAPPVEPVVVPEPVVDEVHAHADRSVFDSIVSDASRGRGRGRSSRG